MLLGLLFLVALGLAEDCPRQYSDDLYSELNCTPIYENRSKCPTNYDCANFEKKDPQRCHLKNKSYAVGESIPEEDAGQCYASCSCRSLGDKVQVVCAHVECPEGFQGPPDNPNCKRLYKADKCCSTGRQCTDTEPANVTCKYKKTTYIAGERFYPSEDKCLTCLCSEGFTGDLVEPYCTRQSCHLELNYSERLRSNYAPVFYEEGVCCPIEWKLPSSDDKIVKPLEKTSSGTTAKCKFGSLELNANEQLETDEDGLECKCIVPPFLTCVRAKREYN